MTVETLKGSGATTAKNHPQVLRPVAALEDGWRGLYRVGGAAALVAGLLFRRNLDAELALLSSMGIIQGGPVTAPVTVVDWLALLAGDRLVGLTLLNLFDMINYALVGLIFLALCVALRRVSASAMAVAAALTLTGVTLYLATNQALVLLALSDQYVGATTAAQRSTLLAAGQAALAIHQQATYTGGIYPSFFLVSAAGLIIATVMRRSSVFGRATAWMGILANAFGLGYYVALAVAPTLVALPLSVSAIFLLAWYILIGRRLLALGRIGSNEAV